MMNLNSDAFINRCETIYYSALTSCLSRIERIRRLLLGEEETPQDSITLTESSADYFTPVVQETLKVTGWTKLNQAFTSIIIWVILGFATGFLFGLINPK